MSQQATFKKFTILTLSKSSVHNNLSLAYKAKGMKNKATVEIKRARQLNTDRY